MWLAIILGGCGDDGGKDGDVVGSDLDDTGTAPPTTPTPSSGRPCASATFGAAGGSLAQDDVVLSVPAGAFDADADVELCTDGVADGFVPVSLVAEITSSATPLVPFALHLPHTAATGAGLALFAEDADGELVRQLRAVEGGGAFDGPIYRPGTVLVAADDRLVEPYDAVRNELVDVLFVVDNSCSMGPEQAQLVDEFPLFFQGFYGSGRDYHIGVTSTDLDRSYNGSQGKLRTVEGVSWIEPATPDPEAVFRQMATLGTTGSGTEQGLGAAYMALETEANGANAGFLRDDAQLGVIVVSDEPDLSSFEVAEFVTWFDGLKVDPATSSLSALVDPLLGGRYADAAGIVGGEVLDIGANDWTPLLRGVLERFDATAQTLAADADAATVEVWVLPADGGEPWPLDPADFTFDDAANTLAVDPGAVAEGDELVVLYVPA